MTPAATSSTPRLGRTPRAVVALLLLGAVLGACSSDSDNGGGTGTTNAAGDTTGDTAGDGDGDGGDGDGDGDGGDGGSDGAFEGECEDLVTLDEAGALFEGEVEFGEDVSGGGVATLSCIYQTPESDDPYEATHMLQVRIWPGAQFYDPDLIYTEHEDVDGVGDDAFVDVTGSVAAGFVDGDVSVSIDYSIIDLGADGASPTDKKDEVVELMRTVHDRMG